MTSAFSSSGHPREKSDSLGDAVFGTYQSTKLSGTRAQLLILTIARGALASNSAVSLLRGTGWGPTPIAATRTPEGLVRRKRNDQRRYARAQGRARGSCAAVMHVSSDAGKQPVMWECIGVKYSSGSGSDASPPQPDSSTARTSARHTALNTNAVESQLNLVREAR